MSQSGTRLILKKVLSFFTGCSRADDLPLDIEAMRAASPVSPDGKRAMFCFGAGRSGMRWLSKIFDFHANCFAGCERFRLEEAFCRYVAWYDLPVDMRGLHSLLKMAINYDWSRGEISFNASPYFCFSVEEMVREHKPSDVFFIMRRPDAVVNSLCAKGWYTEDPSYENRGQIPAVQPGNVGQFHHNFGRILPRGDEYDWWIGLTQVGRVSWYCSKVIGAIDAAFKKLDSTKQWFVRLEDIDQNYDYYRFLAQNFGLRPLMSEADYLQLKGRMSNIGRLSMNRGNWTEKAAREYEEIIGCYSAIYDRTVTTGM